MGETPLWQCRSPLHATLFETKYVCVCVSVCVCVCMCVYVFPNLVPEKNQRDRQSVVFTCVFSPFWIQIQILFNFTFFKLEPFMLTCKFIQAPIQKNVVFLSPEC